MLRVLFIRTCGSLLHMQRGILTFLCGLLVIQIYDNFCITYFLSCELLLVFEITFNLIHSKFILIHLVYDYTQQ